MNIHDELNDGLPVIQGPRKEPLGAPSDKCNTHLTNHNNPNNQYKDFDCEQDYLSSSVFNLTSHLAQVEFRLQQIIKAPVDEKDFMLQELDDFVVKGLPGVRASPLGCSGENSFTECADLEDNIQQEKNKQKDCIKRLKSQLTDLESITPRNDDETVDHVSLMECLKLKLDNLDGRNYISIENLQHNLNHIIHQHESKCISNDEAVQKLQEYSDHIQKIINTIKIEKTVDVPKEKIKKEEFVKQLHNEELKSELANLVRKASTLVKIFTVSQFGCSSKNFAENERKEGCHIHWGNLRARLEISVNKVLTLISNIEKNSKFKNVNLDISEDVTMFSNDCPITHVVRSNLAIDLRNLLHHGLTGPPISSLVPFIGCFPFQEKTNKEYHFWNIILNFYEMNDGNAYNSTPARKLSQSFNLEIMGKIKVSNKHSLLECIGSILSTHIPYKRSFDSQFKAFVCAGLNSQKLVVWLNIILKFRPLIEKYYDPSSYVYKTGFQDSLQSLDRLTLYKFNLPVDQAVKQFQNIKDIFS